MFNMITKSTPLNCHVLHIMIEYNVMFTYIYFSGILGSEKFNDAIELMIGYRINRWFHFCWKYITPLVTVVSLKISSFYPSTPFFGKNIAFVYYK